jgi:hypothetical protein
VLDIGSVTSATSIAALPRHVSGNVLLSTSAPSATEVSSATTNASRSADTASTHDVAQASDGAVTTESETDLAGAMTPPNVAGTEAEHSVGAAEAEAGSTEPTTTVPPLGPELEKADDAVAEGRRPRHRPRPGPLR